MNKKRTQISLMPGAVSTLTILFMTAATASATPHPRCPQRPADAARAKAQARAWYFYGHKLLKGKYFNHAVGAFLCANRMRPARLAIYWAGRSAEAAGRNAQALQFYRRILHNPPQNVPKAQLVGRIARLQRAAAAPGARPGTPAVSRPAIPPATGPTAAPPVPPTLTFKPAARPGARPGTPAPAGVPPGGAATAAPLPPGAAGALAPVAPGPTHRPMPPRARSRKAALRSQMGDAGLTLTVLSGVSFIAAIVLGALVDDNKRELADAEPGSSEAKERQDRIKRMKTGIWACLGVGLATGLVGGILYIARPKKEARPRGTSLMIAPTRKGAIAGVQGRF